MGPPSYMRSVVDRNAVIRGILVFKLLITAAMPSEMVCPWCVHGVSIVCLWCVHSVSIVCPWCVHGVPMVCPWCVHVSMVCPCVHCVHSVSIVCPWCVHDVPMVCQWYVHVVPMVCPWCVHGVSMVCPWCVHGVSSTDKRNAVLPPHYNSNTPDSSCTLGHTAVQSRGRLATASTPTRHDSSYI